MKRVLSLVALCVLIIAVPLSCKKESEQDRVKKVITSLQTAVEEKDAKEVISSFSKSYRDPQGNNYDAIKGLVLGYFYQYPKISLYITSLDVSVEDASARAIFQAVLTGRRSVDATPTVLPESLGLYAFDVTLKKEAGEWKVTSARWERVADTGSS